jgi:putative copper resistance protein D
VDGALLFLRWLHFVAAVSLLGVFSFQCFIGAPAWREAARAGSGVDPGAFAAQLRWIGVAALGLTFFSATGWLFLQASVMSGESLAAVLHSGVAATVLLRTQVGHVWLGRVLLLTLLALVLLSWTRPKRSSRVSLSLALVLASAQLLGLVWAGHAGAARGLRGAVEQTADAIHLLAAGIWLGGLVPLALLLGAAGRADDRGWLVVAQTASTRFSRLGLLCVLSLLPTGIVNSWFLVGDLGALWRTDYGRCLLLKLALFGVALGIAALNRLRLVPRVSSFAVTAGVNPARRTIQALQRNTAIEVGLGFLILGVVGLLGTLPPAAQVHRHLGFTETRDQSPMSMEIERLSSKAISAAS